LALALTIGLTSGARQTAVVAQRERSTGKAQQRAEEEYAASLCAETRAVLLLAGE